MARTPTEGLRRLKLHREFSVAIAGVVVLSSCGSFDASAREFDSISARAADGREPSELDYQSSAMRYAWPLRWMEGTGVDVVLVRLLALSPEPVPIANPGGFARDRIAELAPLAVGDLQRVAQAAVRLLWVADLDANPLNQVVALRGLQLLLEDIGGDPTTMVHPSSAADIDAQLAALLAVYESGWPGSRGDAPLSEPLRSEYRDVLGALVERPLPRPTEQRNLIRSLSGAVQLETDAELRAVAQESLVAALRHGIYQSFRRSVRAAPSDAVREVAMQMLLRSSGRNGLPFVLATIARPPATVIMQGNRYDASESVRRYLIRVCAQATPEQLEESFDGGPEPIEFLYDTIAERPGSPSLRMTAMEAFCLATRRDVSYEYAKATEWYDDFTRRKRAR